MHNYYYFHIAEDFILSKLLFVLFDLQEKGVGVFPSPSS